jgi:hypothetical protein
MRINIIVRTVAALLVFLILVVIMMMATMAQPIHLQDDDKLDKDRVTVSGPLMLRNPYVETAVSATQTAKSYTATPTLDR